MTTHDTGCRRVGRVFLCGVLAAMAGLSASALAGESEPGGGVARFRRGGNPGSEGAVRATRRDAEPPRDLSPQGRITPDAGGSGDGGESGGPDGLVLSLLEDDDGERAGLPDAVAGEGGAGAVTGESFVIYEIGARGKREGRRVAVVGAEFVFANRDIEVTEGLAIGHTGARGQTLATPGAAPYLEFTVRGEGELVLTVQPRAASLTAPSRPVHTVRLSVP